MSVICCVQHGVTKTCFNMRVTFATLLTIAMLALMAVDEVLHFGVGPRLFSSGPTAGAAFSREALIAGSAPVRDAEVAERRACRGLAQLDLFAPRTSCEAR